MQTVGYLTGYLDLPQVLLYMFWLFFFGLIYYLVREGHREGYPMESDSMGRAVVTGFPIPGPKTFKLAGGKSVTVPELHRPEPQYSARSTAASPGSPIEPVGNPMMAGVGAGAHAMRADVPDMTSHGTPLIVPLRVAKAYSVAPKDVDPRGLPVMGGDGKPGGVVRDIWLDSAEMMFRYLEVEVAGKGANMPNRRVLLPIAFSRIRRNMVEVNSIYGMHFADVPGTRSPDQVTLLEEEKICAYYGAGTLYADPKRVEAMI
jgi:photosynthetic reaction center H subunit